MNKKFETICHEKIKYLIENNLSILLDVRTEDEYDIKRIENSINIPIQELSDRIEELDKTKSYICFCARGVRSLAAATILHEEGFENIYNGEEGIVTWKY